ncbi:MAG: M1 family metallopeptidase [Nanoarchaeota archaeon]|nr:M1 family metallopeptidase [Nanoarchaeota archaeon]
MREFKFTPEDFGALKVNVEHMDLVFDMHEKETHVSSDIHLTAKIDLKEMELNAKELKIHAVECDCEDVEFSYDKDKDLLKIKFKNPVKKGKSFTIHTETTCRPTKNVLEGLYYDETPKNAPCQLITQCQQWGFQRIVPCIDDMTAKCTYKTTIIADSRYTHLLTNGDVSIPRESAGKGRDRIRYDNAVTPMATYLFFLGCGTYASFTREFEYPDGKKFLLELLVPPGNDKEAAEHALDILHDGILWIYLFTGPEMYTNLELRHELKSLVEKREQLKKEGKDVTRIREELREKVKKIASGYQYTGTVYREIGMQNSDFGGMENVGNTTITTNRIMPFSEMSDGAFEYMIRVKVHEFYHNLNGSEVTGRSPFEIWLNEAVTVFIETKYHAFLFGEDYSRLDTVQDLLAPVGGTFSLDESAASMPIEPEGFNDPNELITGMTYVKAPEFVRMIETLLGKEKFAKGLHLYHSRYQHANASRQQWVEAMEEVSGLKLTEMARLWLKQTGYPIVEAKTLTSKGKLTLRLKQKGKKRWEFPITAAVVDATGKDIQEQSVWMQKPEQEMLFDAVKRPVGFLSLNRSGSFYGKAASDASDEELYLQAMKDSDIVNRYLAFYRLADKEKLELIEGKKEVGNRFTSLYFSLLSDKRLMDSVGPQIIAIFESVEDNRYRHAYQKLYDARKQILTRIGTLHEKELLKMYSAYANVKPQGTYVEKQVRMIKARQVKNTALGLLSKLDTPHVHAILKKQIAQGSCATDRNSAFSLYLNSSAKDKMAVLEAFEAQAKKSLVSWESFLGIAGGNDSDDCIGIMKRIEKSPNFRIEQTNDQRALYGSFCANRRTSLQTDSGREYLTEILKKLSPINEYTTGRLLTTFGAIDQMEGEYHADVAKILVDVLKTLDAKKTPSVVNTIKRILKNSPKCVKAFEGKYGKVNLV